MQLSFRKRWKFRSFALAPAVISGVVLIVLYANRPIEAVRYISLSEAQNPSRQAITASLLSVRHEMTYEAVIVSPDHQGNFVVAAKINGKMVPMVFDTGASFVALTFEDAKRAGLDPQDGDFSTQLETANGVVLAAHITLPKLAVGGIVQENVDTYIMPSGKLRVSLLGRSFWGRLAQGFTYSSGELVLKD